VDIRSQIVDLHRDARQDRLEIQGMFRAILDRLPPASGLQHHHQARDVFVTSWLFFFTPLCTTFVFFYLHTVDSANFEFGVILFCCAHFIFDYAFLF
jgi:hypothetical protein